jgi:hypothetical protein
MFYYVLIAVSLNVFDEGLDILSPHSNVAAVKSCVVLVNVQNVRR